MTATSENTLSRHEVYASAIHAPASARTNTVRYMIARRCLLIFSIYEGSLVKAIDRSRVEIAIRPEYGPFKPLLIQGIRKVLRLQAERVTRTV